MKTIEPLLLASLVLLGCGGPQEVVAVVSSPFGEEHAAVFEDGLDLVRDPRVLEGSWLESWEDELARRVEMSDVVALVTIRTVRTDVDLDRQRTYRLLARVDRVLFGQGLTDEVMFAVREGQGGFSTIESRERLILDEQYIAFIKWAEEEDGGVRARWHLSPSTDHVATRVQALLQSRRGSSGDDDGTRRRVIIHRD